MSIDSDPIVIAYPDENLGSVRIVKGLSLLLKIKNRKEISPLYLCFNDHPLKLKLSQNELKF